MAIFPVFETEDIVQTLDKTRLNATKSFVSKDNASVTLVEIEPEAGNGFIVVTGTSYKDWYLDWVYSGSSRSVTVTVRITAGSTQTLSKTISVLNAADDYLFSSDQDIRSLEPDVLRWVPDGKSSFLSVHREAQKKIMDWLDEAGIEDFEGQPLTKSAIVNLNEVRSWSKYICLSLIYFGISNAVDDVFSTKARHYETLAKGASDRAKLRIDLDGDGNIDLGESVRLTSRDLVRE